MTWSKTNLFDQSSEEINYPRIEEKYTIDSGPSSSNEIDFRDENDEMLAEMDDEFVDLTSDFSV